MNTPARCFGVHHIGMRSENLDKSLSFYVDGLGFEIVLTFDWENGGRAVILDMGNRNYLEIGNDGAPEPIGRLTHFALEVENCEAMYQRALAAGGLPKAPPSRSTVIQAKPSVWDMYFAYVIGPDGEEIEFIQTLACPFPVPGKP